MRPCMVPALWLLFLSFCCDSTTGNLEVLCITNGRKVEFKPQLTNGTTSNVLIMLNGSSLNCICMTNSSILPYNISWTSKEKQLKQLMVNDSSAVKLTLPVIGWASNGSIHECKPVNLSQTDSIQFQIIVGDQPGPPQNLKHDSFYQNLRVNWTAASFTGNLLPVKYSVRFSLKDQSLWHYFPQCRNFAVACLKESDENGYQEYFLHVPGKGYSCFVWLDLIKDQRSSCIYEGVTYRLWVTAENAIGSSNSSDVLEMNSTDLKYGNSPLRAPKDVNIMNITPSSFKVSFHKGKFWRLDTGLYGDCVRTKLAISDNKKIVKCIPVLLEDSKTFNIVVEDLEPWTLYRVCIQVRIERKGQNHRHTAFSMPECFAARTKEDAPRMAPTITSCNRFAMGTNHSELQPVNISWNNPPKDTWSSPWLEGFLVLYLGRDGDPEGHTRRTFTVENTSTHYLLQLPPHASFDFWVKAYNTKGSSKKSRLCHVQASAVFPRRPDFGNNTKPLIIFAICGAVIVPVLITVALYIKCKKQPSYRNLPADIIQATSPTYQYDKPVDKDELEAEHEDTL